jgi:hypothetical protein
VGTSRRAPLDGEAPKDLLHDRDDRYGPSFDRSPSWSRPCSEGSTTTTGGRRDHRVPPPDGEVASTGSKPRSRRGASNSRRRGCFRHSRTDAHRPGRLFGVLGRPVAEDQEHDGPRKGHCPHEQERQVRGHSDPFKGVVHAAHEKCEAARMPIAILDGIP